MYFKRKAVAPLFENVCLGSHKCLGWSQVRCQSHWAHGEKSRAKAKCLEEAGTSPSTQQNTGLQLFHISSLVTRFGESYSFVANHINSMFCLELKKVPTQANLGHTSSKGGNNENHGKRKMQHAAQFGVEHKALEWNDHKLRGRREQHPAAQTEEPISPDPEGLFHGSQRSTTFGEQYLKIASHINQYFKGQRGPSEKSDLKHLKEADSEASASTSTILDYLLHPKAAIPGLLGEEQDPLTQTSKPPHTMTLPEAILNRKNVWSRTQSEELTSELIVRLKLASSPEALTSCVEALNDHLIRHPSCKASLWQDRTVVTLLRNRRAHRDNQPLQSALRETLASIGYVEPVKGWGIRVLSIDGGGTRGVVPLQVLKLLENETGRKIHQLFDYICGVSTGAVLAFMLGLARFSLEECAEMYRRFGSEVFHQNRLVGTVKMGWTHSYYDTETWEKVLRGKLGNRLLIKTARDESSIKVSAVSAVVNWGSSPKAFVFRNYNHKPGYVSHYSGGSAYQMWQAVRASSAAPGYFQEFPLRGDIHQDGGIILNNPCALAVHESRLLWPSQPFQCVLSLGTGRCDNSKRGPATSTSLRAKINSLISSATDTEGVHTLLDDLLAPDVYFRFNPLLSSVVSLDENRPCALDQLQRDTAAYLERNCLKMSRLCAVLRAERSAVSRTKDWMRERAWEMKQRCTNA